MRRLVLTLTIAGMSAGCYHAIVNTGRPPSNVVIENRWAHGYLWGLIPPMAVYTAVRCPDGVSKVETQHSILNLLAHGLTAGVYTPMHVTVTCAARATLDAPALSGRRDDAATALRRAADLSALAGTPVLLELR